MKQRIRGVRCDTDSFNLSSYADHIISFVGSEYLQKCDLIDISNSSRTLLRA
jgi:hypothetical protein